MNEHGVDAVLPFQDPRQDSTGVIPAAQPEQGRSSAQASVWTTVALAVFLLLVYSLFPTKNHYWDGIGFALDIEGIDQDGPGVDPSIGYLRGISNVYFNPNHLLHNMIGYLIYRPLHQIAPDVRALDILKTISILSSVASACLIFLMLSRWLRNLRLSIWLTLLMAFSAVWWKFSTDANAYVPSVFLLVLASFLLTNPRRCPSGVKVGMLHALSMLLHQISIFFFPAVIVAIWAHPNWRNAREKRRAVFTYTLAAGVPVLAAYCWVWFGVLDGGWSFQEFTKWMTSNGSDVYEFKSIPSNALKSLWNLLRVFFGGRFSLAFGFIKMPWLVVLVALMLTALACFVAGVTKELRSRIGLPHVSDTDETPDAVRKFMMKFALAWGGAFSLFLFFWLTQYPYYRLFFLPALILLIGILLRSRGAEPTKHRIGPLPAFVVFMAALNFTFYIYPYSKIEANSSRKLAADAKGIWNDDTLVLYKDFTCDNWMMKYFNTQTTWSKIDFSNRENVARQLSDALGTRRAVWVDTTVLGYLTSTPEAREWLESHASLSANWGVANKHNYIQFAQLIRR